MGREHGRLVINAGRLPERECKKTDFNFRFIERTGKFSGEPHTASFQSAGLLMGIFIDENSFSVRKCKASFTSCLMRVV